MSSVLTISVCECLRVGYLMLVCVCACVHVQGVGQKMRESRLAHWPDHDQTVPLTASQSGSGKRRAS